MNKVKQFYLHPEYNVNAKVNEGVKEFYDYDVALILLEESVDISITARWELFKHWCSFLDLVFTFSDWKFTDETVPHTLNVISWNIILSSFRPICIPCTEETNAALKLDADSTCKNQGELTVTQFDSHEAKNKYSSSCVS